MKMDDIWCSYYRQKWLENGGFQGSASDDDDDVFFYLYIQTENGKAREKDVCTCWHSFCTEATTL